MAAPFKLVFAGNVNETWRGDDYTWRIMLLENVTNKRPPVFMRNGAWDELQRVAKHSGGLIKITHKQQKALLKIRGGPAIKVEFLSDERLPFCEMSMLNDDAHFLREIFHSQEGNTISEGLLNERGIDVARSIHRSAVFSHILFCNESGLREPFTVFVRYESEDFVITDTASERLESLVSTLDAPISIDLELMKFRDIPGRASFDLIFPGWFWKTVLESENERMSLPSFKQILHFGKDDCVVCMSSMLNEVVQTMLCCRNKLHQACYLQYLSSRRAEGKADPAPCIFCRSVAAKTDQEMTSTESEG